MGSLRIQELKNVSKFMVVERMGVKLTTTKKMLEKKGWKYGNCCGIIACIVNVSNNS